MASNIHGNINKKDNTSSPCIVIGNEEASDHITTKMTKGPSSDDSPDLSYSTSLPPTKVKKTTNLRPYSSTIRSGPSSSSINSSEDNGISDKDDKDSLEGVIKSSNRLLSSSVSFLESIAASQYTEGSHMTTRTTKLFKRKKDPLKKFYSRFPIVLTQPNFVYYTYYKCTLERGFGSRGKLYITNRDLFFYGKLLGKRTKLQIPYQDILHMDKLQHPLSIRVTTMSSQYIFSRFKRIDSAFAVLVHLWQCHIDGIEPPTHFEKPSLEHLQRQPIENIKSASSHKRKQSKDDSFLNHKDTGKKLPQSSLRRRSSFIAGLHTSGDTTSFIDQSIGKSKGQMKHRSEPSAESTCKSCSSTHYNYIMINETFPTSSDSLISILFGVDTDRSNSHLSLYTNAWITSRGMRLLHVSDWNKETKERKVVYEIPIDEKFEFFYQGETSIVLIEVQGWKQTGSRNSHLLECLLLFPTGKLYQEDSDHVAHCFSGMEVKMKYCITNVHESECHMVVTADVNIISDVSSISSAQTRFVDIIFTDMSLLNDLILKRLCDDHEVNLSSETRINCTWYSLSWRPNIQLSYIYSDVILGILSIIARFTKKAFLTIYLLSFYGTFPIFLYIDDSYTRISKWYKDKVNSSIKHRGLLVLIIVWMILTVLLIWVFLWGGEASFINTHEHYLEMSYWYRKWDNTESIIYKLMRQEFQKMTDLLNKIQSCIHSMIDMAF